MEFVSIYLFFYCLFFLLRSYKDEYIDKTEEEDQYDIKDTYREHYFNRFMKVE